MDLSRRDLLLGAAALPLIPSRQEPPEPYYTAQDKFRDVSRGKPKPFALSPEKRAEVGLTRETWKLEILSDPEHPAQLGRPKLTVDWAMLMKLAERRAVRLPKIMTCNNISRPLGMGLWEGVPLRDLLWLAEPKADVRRVFYYGYHNDDPEQMFRSSLPIGRALEDPPGMPPVIVCFMLNGQFLTPERGGPVRMVVPEAYGFKSIKWLSRVVLTNLPVANDTYMEENNDVDSLLKTAARALTLPKEAKAGQPIRVQGLAQVGVSGLAKVQVWVTSTPWPADDPWFTKAPWTDATILAAPAEVGDKPRRFTKAHWAAELPGLAEGTYTFRCRTIDENGAAQPMPRPFRKSGQASIEELPLVVKA